jgi:hypothetical protein
LFNYLHFKQKAWQITGLFVRNFRECGLGLALAAGWSLPYVRLLA